jgi:diguanylate cyclase (GGDEF)-like protein/PAS domain S-box-containing protein
MAARDLVLMALGTFLLAVGLKLLTSSAANVSGIWLANGFGLAILLTVPRDRWPLLIAASAFGAIAGALYLRSDPVITLWIGAIVTAELALAAMLLHGRIGSVRDLTRRPQFLRFLLVCVLIAPLAMQGLLLLYGWINDVPRLAMTMVRIYIAHALGFAVMAPVTLALRSGEFRRFLQPAVLPEALLMLLAVGGTATLVFFYSGAPLLFLVYLPLMRVAYRGGYSGTAIGLLVVMLVGTIATGMGEGPLAALAAQPGNAGLPVLGDGFIMLQLFMVALLVALFPMILSLAEGRRAHRATEELQNRLRLLMEHSSDVIILTDLDGRRLYVSPAVREVLGYSQDEFQSLTWRDYVHGEDQLVVGSQFEEARLSKGARTVVFRARNASGNELWLEAQLRYFHDRALVVMREEKERGVPPNCGPDGDEGFVVTLRDISARRQAELALECANTELASLARKDGLTGLANRRHFDDSLRESWQRALDGGWPIAVLLIDVDHFKQFNDCHGHQRGDACLREVAAAIGHALFHPEDLATRYGGEEFAVILPRTSTDNAAHVAERIRRAVMDMRRPHLSAPLGVVTVSVGVAAAFPVGHGDPEAVVKAADEALYISKREGRNRTTLLDVNWPEGSAATG